MSINWERGLKRLSYLFIATIWLLTIFVFSADSPAKLGENIVYLLLFTLGYMLTFKAVVWAIRGFKQDS